MIKQFGFLVVGIFVLSSCQNKVQKNDSIDFKDGDVVCFIGNSITHGGMYHAFVQLYTATRFPDENIKYINCGVAGSTAHEMLRRLDSDVLIHQPDYAFLMVGMNDVLRDLYSYAEADSATLQKRADALNKYYASSEELVLKLLENKIQPILMTPSIYDQTAKIASTNQFGVNDVLGLCAKHIEGLALKYNTPLIDLYSVMNTLNNKGQEKDSSYTLIGNDRIHPGKEGHFVMATEIIKTLFARKCVTSINIDAKSRQILAEENCSTTLQPSSEGVRFQVLENALPFPISDEIKAIAEVMDFENQLNQQKLIVQHLDKGSYQLTIDSVILDTLSALDFNNGVNIALYEHSPQYVQAKKIEELCFEYLRIQTELREIAVVRYKMLYDYTGPDTNAEKRAFLDAKLANIQGEEHRNWLTYACLTYFRNLPKADAFWAELDSIQSKIHQLNTPQTHQYSISGL